MKKIALLLVIIYSTYLLASSVSTGGGSGASAWGDITGTLSNQSDLNTALSTTAKGVASSTTFALVRFAATDGKVLSGATATLNTAGVLNIPVSTVGDGTTNALTFGTGAVGMSNVASNSLRLAYRGQEHSFRDNSNLQMINFSQDGIYLYPTIGASTDYAIINYDTNAALSIETSGYPVQLKAGAEVGVKITTTGSAILGKASLGTGATGGFAYVPASAGTPTGTPVSQTGYVAITVDTTAHKLYFYSGGAWRDAGP